MTSLVAAFLPFPIIFIEAVASTLKAEHAVAVTAASVLTAFLAMAAQAASS